MRFSAAFCEPGDGLGTLLHVVADVGETVAHVPALVLPGEFENPRGHGVRRHFFEEPEQFHERAFAQHVKEE